MKKLITIICPVHNEEETIPLFYNRIKTVISQLTDKYDFELLFSNNSSTDNSLGIIKQLQVADKVIRYITLSRNFGYQRSLMAALSQANCDAVIIIDVDCEDPPEMIPTFIEAWQNEGCDIVYGERDLRPEPRLILLYRKLFYRLLTRISDSPTILDMAEFSLFNSKVKNLILKNSTTTPFIRNEIAYVGFRRKAIKYNREKRIAGKTHYNLFRMLVFAVAGILTASTYPLRLALYLLIPLLLSNMLLFCVYLITGSATLFNCVLWLDLMYIMYSVGFIAVYLARVYNDVIARPLFIIDWDNSYISKQNA